jgi:hypothetical protein
MNYGRTARILLPLLLIAMSTLRVQADVAPPTFVRSINTASYRSAVTHPDGSALVVTKEGVIRRDAAGGTRYVLRLKGNQRVSHAEEANVFGVVTYADNSPSTLHAFRFDVYDDSGTRQFRLEKPEASEFRMSGDGRWIVGIAGGDGMLEARLFLYDNKGEIKATWTVPYLSDLTMPTSGDRFFAASRGNLMAFPYSGGQPHPLGRFEVFTISSDGRYAALCGAGSVALYEDNRLSFLVSSDLTQPRAVGLSKDGGYVAVAASDRMELFSGTQGDLLWTVTSGRPGLRFMSVDLRLAPTLILAGLDFDAGAAAQPAERHRSGAVFLFGESGQLIWRDELTYTNWSFHVPAVRILEDRRRFEVKLADEVRQYRLP